MPEHCKFDFDVFAAFGIDWFNGDVDLEDLADFCDNWLLEHLCGSKREVKIETKAASRCRGLLNWL